MFKKTVVDGFVHNAFASLPFRPAGKVPWSYCVDAIRVSVGARTVASELVSARESVGIKSIVTISSIYAERAPNFSIYGEKVNPNPIYYGPIKLLFYR